jgi:hypothetical protein
MSTGTSTFFRVSASRSVRAVAAVLGAVLACTLATPTAAHASAPNPGSILSLTVDRSNPDVVTFTLTADTAVGDCVALSGGTLQVPRPSTSGVTYVAWDQLSYTNHTNHYDQWHSEITLLGADGSSYLVPTRLDSARMYTARQVYGWTSYSIIFPMTSGFYEQINRVQWTAYC